MAGDRCEADMKDKLEPTTGAQQLLKTHITFDSKQRDR